MNEMTKNLIVFLVPPEKFTSGGIISIFSLCKETRLVCGADTNVVIAAYPGTESYKKNDLFDNDEIIYDFDEVVNKNTRLDTLTIHIPEYSVGNVYQELDKRRLVLKKIAHVQINILNQNIQLMASEGDVASLLTLTDTVTQTTAHIKYTNQRLADKYSIPTHLFSVRIDPKQYHHTPYVNKKDIITISPDQHPYRDKIIQKLKDETSYEVIELENLTFEEYKKLVSRAKFTLTFGEGMDGYFIESLFSDSIGLTIYNETFFPSKEYAQLDNVYSDAETLHENIVTDITNWGSDKKQYTEVNKAATRLLLEIYGEDRFHENVRAFYNKEYSFTPSFESREAFLLKAIAEKDSKRKVELKQIKSQLDEKNHLLEDIALLNSAVNQKSLEIVEIKKVADERYDEIVSLRASLSWKMTAPLRSFTKKVRKSK